MYVHLRARHNNNTAIDGSIGASCTEATVIPQEICEVRTPGGSPHLIKALYWKQPLLRRVHKGHTRAKQ